MISAKQTPAGYKFAPFVASQLENKGERTSTGPLALGYPALGPSRHVGHTIACRSPALAFSAAIHFAMKCSAPCSAVLRHSPSSWAIFVHWSVLMPKALRLSRKHLIHSFSCPTTQLTPPPILRTSRTSAVSYPPCAP